MPTVESARQQDLYELLQVSPKAHPLIITKAYRLLAAMYHPDNKESGDAEAFRQVTEAYRVLSDPVKRAAYHQERLGPLGPRTWSDEGAEADPLQSVAGRHVDERELRALLLRALYDVRRGRPYKPGISFLVLAELFGCPIDDLQFTLWYLRGRRLIDLTDESEVVITVAGVDHVEATGLAGNGSAEHGTGAASTFPLPHVLATGRRLALTGGRNGSGPSGHPAHASIGAAAD